MAVEHHGDASEEGGQDGPHEGPAAWRGWVSQPEHGSGWDFGADVDHSCQQGCLEWLAIAVALAAAIGLGWLLHELWR